MNRPELIGTIKNKRSFLCVGLDTDETKIPIHLQKTKNALLEFNKQIIDATKDHCVSYKINTAFYEALGAKGWELMEETVKYIPSSHFKIADAKRGDIGNTSTQYARAFFETMAFDAITLHPYMGEDSIRPFLEFENKWAIVLGLTSNPGANNFEMLKVNDGKERPGNGKGELHLFEKVIETTIRWGTPENLMFVAGATQSQQLQKIRKIIPEHFLLVPGVGSQGGSLEEVARYGMNTDCGLLVNVSRGVIYAGQNEDFAIKAREACILYQKEMERSLTLS